jgi:hypothetical protein
MLSMLMLMLMMLIMMLLLIGSNMRDIITEGDNDEFAAIIMNSSKA